MKVGYQMTVSVRKATTEDARRLHTIILAALEDKNSEVYKANVERFGVPEEFVRQAFSLEMLRKAVKDENQLFLVAVRNQELIGFAQTIRTDEKKAELDRMLVVPEETGKGIGARLLRRTVDMLRRESFGRLTVKTGKDETLARRFYEKYGFKLVEETTIKARWGRELKLAIYELKIKD